MLSLLYGYMLVSLLALSLSSLYVVLVIWLYVGVVVGVVVSDVIFCFWY